MGVIMTIQEIAHKVVSEWYGYQNETEMEFALKTVQAFRPKVIVEIGTAYNASIAAWCEIAKPELAIGIDPLTLPETPEKGEMRKKLAQDYNIQIVPFRSEKPEAQQGLEKILNGRKIDFLFIDGEHLEEYVRYDYYQYLKYMNEPSLIGFHDIYYSKVLDKAGTGVWKVWEEAKSKYNYDELHYHSSMGIGMVYYPQLRVDNI